MNKTHKVLDLMYHEEEGQECYAGTYRGCESFVGKQSCPGMFKIVPLTADEIDSYSGYPDDSDVYDLYD